MASFRNLIYDRKTNTVRNTQTECWTAKDIENIIYFINLRLAQRNALEGKSPLGLRCCLVADLEQKNKENKKQ